MSNPTRTLDVTIELTSPSTFDVHFLENETGDRCTISCTDARDPDHDVRLAAEIRSWVQIMREDQEFRETEAFARKYHEEHMFDDAAGDDDEYIELSYTEAWGDIMNYLKSRSKEWYEERERTKESVLNDADLIDELTNEHLRCVNRYGCDREWSVQDACCCEPGI